MAAFALTNSELLQGAVRLTCQANTFSLDIEASTQDATTFCSGGWSEMVDTIRGWSLTAGGFADVATGGADELSWAQFGASNPTSVVPVGTPEGAVAYVGSGRIMGYGPFGGDVGDLAAANWSIKGSAPMARGVLASNVDAIAVTTTGPNYQLGAVAAGERVVMGVHVLAATGTWAVRLESDSSTGFASPATVATQSGIAAAGGFLLSSTAVATDTFWRAVFTRTSGTLTAMVTIGII